MSQLLDRRPQQTYHKHFEFVPLLSGCQVSGPWNSDELDDLTELVQDLHLCSQGLNKLDREALKQSRDKTQPHGHFLDRNAKFLLSAASSSWRSVLHWWQQILWHLLHICWQWMNLVFLGNPKSTFEAMCSRFVVFCIFLFMCIKIVFVCPQLINCQSELSSE